MTLSFIVCGNFTDLALLQRQQPLHVDGFHAASLWLLNHPPDRFTAAIEIQPPERGSCGR
ncbi:MAG: hypothetical protein ACREYF_12050 [Gammaproteobacteria bacterium]